MTDYKGTIRSHIWREEEEPGHPFQTKAYYCAGYDVFGEVIQKATPIEYWFLLFKGERPTALQLRMLEVLAIALANPGPRDHSIRAAMNGGVGGSSMAASLMAALAVGAGSLGGGREIQLVVQGCQHCELDLDKWLTYLKKPPEDERADTWLPIEHPPGFDPNADQCAKPVMQLLDYLTEISGDARLQWLSSQRQQLEKELGMPLAMVGVAGFVLFCLDFTVDEAEALFLILRLPGAALHAMEQKQQGWRHYPFFHEGIKLINDPGQVGRENEQ